MAESAVVGLPHPDFGEQVTAVVVRAPGVHGPDERSVIDALKRDLAGFKVPKQVFFAEELPRNAMGKVQKSVLRERLIDFFNRYRKKSVLGTIPGPR